MKVFIWEDVGQLTDSYHSGGGCVVIAENIEKAYALLMADDRVSRPVAHQGNIQPFGDGEDLTTVFGLVPDVVLDVSGETPERVFVFPDAGCC